MNRQSLAEATSLHDGPVPVYLMEEIAGATKASARDAEKIADYMLGRLNKSNLNVKLKALQIISYCIREGGPAFSGAIREEEQELSNYLQFSGPPDPVYGDEKYRRIRVASQEALVCLNDGVLSRRNETPPPPQQPQAAPGGGNTWQAASGGAPASSYGSQQQQSGPQVGGSWGSAASSGSSSRPPPYQDNPAGGRGGYNAPPAGGYGGNASYGQSAGGYGSNSSNVGGYGQSHSNAGGYGYNQNGPSGRYPQQQQPPQQPQPSGFDSWAAPPSGGLPAKSTGSGIWSNAGYQKKEVSASSEPRYNPSTRRDNRPTVLVGHSLNFPKPSGGFGSSSSGSSSGLGGFNSGTYNPRELGAGSRDGPGGYNPNASGGGGFGGQNRHHQPGGTPSYVDNTNRMLNGSSHRIGSMGLPVNGQALADMPTSKLGQRVQVLKKIGNEALEKWDRRNLDKSMASSLADHDELRAGPQVLDRGYYQPNAQQGTGGGDTSKDYERGMIDSLCAPAGLSRAPPADGLKRFVDLAQTLDSQTIGDILLDKLEDPTWQVRLKALHVVLALLNSPGSAPYMEWFEDNVDVVEELCKDGKPSVVSKARQVLRALGFEPEKTTPPSSGRRTSARSERGVNSPARATSARGQQQEVDLLGFGGLSLGSSAGPPQRSSPAGSADLLGSPAGGPMQRSSPAGSANLLGSPAAGAAPPPAPTPAQEVSLLDGFDPLGASSSSTTSYQQQYYQQQPIQPHDDRATALGHFGKDLFTVANSPRNTAAATPGSAEPGDIRSSGGQSAFNFM